MRVRDVRDWDPGVSLPVASSSPEENKELVRRLVQEAVGQHNLDVLDEVAAGEFGRAARRWVQPFRSAFPDFEMEIVELIAEGDKVVGHFRCSGTHRGEWLGVPATGRRFEQVDEIYVFEVRDGKLVSAVGVEDNLTRLRQLGIVLAAPRPG
jgi:predicted ester cyclase